MMKKTNKLLTLMLASTMLFAACDNNNAKSEEAATNTQVEEKTNDKATDNAKADDASQKLDANTVAMVNGEAISKDDYKKEIDFYGSYLASQENLKASVVQIMIQDRLIAEDLKKNNIKITDQEVSDAFMQAVTAAGGQEQFDKLLDDYNFDVDMYRENIKKNLMYQKHKEWFDETHKVTDEEINEYFEENKDQFQRVDASHILVEDEATAKEVKEKLDNGEDWDKLAAEYSKDTMNANDGGNLGEFAQGDMVKEFNDAAFSMKAGEISEPIKTQFGYHIIKLNKVLDNVEDSKELITNTLMEQKYADYFKELNENADIVSEFSDKAETETIIETEDTNADENKEETESTEVDEDADEDAGN